MKKKQIYQPPYARTAARIAAQADADRNGDNVEVVMSKALAFDMFDDNPADKVSFLDAILSGSEIVKVSDDSFLIAQHRTSRGMPYIFRLSIDINDINLHCIK